MSPHDEVLFEVRDREGRRVVLTRERWEHVLRKRPGMANLMPEVMRAVREPSEVIPGRRRGEEWLFLAGAGPTKWLQVVVQIDGPAGGRIITAFPRSKLPRRKTPWRQSSP